MSKTNIPDSSSSKFNEIGYKILNVIGWVFVVFGVVAVILFIMDFASDEYTKKEVLEGIEGGIVIICAGVAILIPINIRRNKRAKLQNYVNLIIHQQITELDVISGIMHKEYRIVVKDVQALIGRRYFEGAYVDERSRTIVFPYGVPRMVIEKYEEVFVICKSCAATNKVIVGQVKNCEYCGSPISVEKPNKGKRKNATPNQ